jgi:hypothetical protein
VILFGKTAAGKSTTIHYLLGKKMGCKIFSEIVDVDGEKLKVNRKFIDCENDNDKLPEFQIGNSAMS